MDGGEIADEKCPEKDESFVIATGSKYDEGRDNQINDDPNSRCCHTKDSRTNSDLKMEIGDGGRDSSPVSTTLSDTSDTSVKISITEKPNLPANEVKLIIDSITEDLLSFITDSEKDDVSEINGKIRLEEQANNEKITDVSIKLEAAEEISEPTVDKIEIGEEVNTNSNANTNAMVKVEESISTATVLIAAPYAENTNLKIVGEDDHLGKWKHPKGKFESSVEINTDLRIFKGTIPVPSKSCSEFKFVHVDIENKMEYEGWGNRKNELLPETWNFFIFQPNSKKSRLSKIWKSIRAYIYRGSESGEKIAFEIFRIVFNHTCENVLPEWDRAFDFLIDSLHKIREATGACSSNGFLQFINEWVRKAELQVNFDLLLLLIIGAYSMNVYSPELKDFVNLKRKEFSIYLHNFIIDVKSRIKFKWQDFNGILESIAIHAGSEFWWLLFRINRHSEVIEFIEHKEMFQSIINILEESPEVLLENLESATRVVDFLIQCPIEELYYLLRPFLSENKNYKQLFIRLLLQRLLVHKTSIDDLIRILKSDFMKEAAHLNGEEKEKILFDESIKSIFNQSISNVIKLACCTPTHMLPAVVPVVEAIVYSKKGILNFTKEDYNYFATLNESILKDFPQAKQQIESQVLNMTMGHVNLGLFREIPSVKLILLGLAKKEDLLLLERPNVAELQNAIGKLPRNFFQNLHYVFKKSDTCMDKLLKPFRKGETKDVVEKLENHFDQLDGIVNKIQSRNIPLIDLSILQDPRVLDCLKNVGFEEWKQFQFRQEVDKLRGLHKLIGLLYSRFSRLDVITLDGTQQHLENDEDVIESKAIQILDPQEWEEEYLMALDAEMSTLTLQEAIDLPLPCQMADAQWLVEVRECALFMNTVWQSMVKELQVKGRQYTLDEVKIGLMDKMGLISEIYPLCKEDFHYLVNQCASEWKDLARTVANESTSFQQMEEIIRMAPDPDILCRKHLMNGLVIEGVPVAYRNFKTLKEIRQIIGPFVTALRYFTIRERDPIENMYHFIQSNLLDQWDTTTLAKINKNGILKILHEDLNLNIFLERPETLEEMRFLSSLVTDENSSPLLEWLREKNENDMEAMGKILQGHLLVAYDQIQTLRTRIAPFYGKEFNTYRDLLKFVRESEESFAQRMSGRVQPIKCKWLADILPDIQAAIRASVISPSEDAKEKLAKLHHVVINSQNESYSIEISLEPTGSLSMEELKQAFQLLDMAEDMSVIEDLHNREDLVGRTRRNVGQIEQLSEVFGLLFASGCVSYILPNQIVIKLANLETVIPLLRVILDEWNQLWKDIEEMPLLALFSRGYLLQLADLISQKKSEDASSILKISLPSADIEMETIVNQLIARAPCINETDNWLSTAQLLKIFSDLNQLIEVVFHEKSCELSLPSFLVNYGEMLKSHFIDKSVIILNVSGELLVGSALAAYISLTRQPLEPSRILFVTTNTDKMEVERFMKLWSVANFEKDFFIIVHVERLTVAGASAVRDGVDKVLPERRAKLLLLAQHHYRVQSTKSLGARLGLISDRLIEINFTPDQLRHCFCSLLPNAANLHFFTSKLPGSGKSQQAIREASNLVPRPEYYRISVRIGSIEELLTSLKKIDNLSRQSKERSVYLHLDIANSVSLEFNDILLSLLIHGALYDPKKAKLGYWLISQQTTIALEFASPFGVNEFPIIAYLGKHNICECERSVFTYELAEMPLVGQPISVNFSNALVAAGKFLQLQQAGEDGLQTWDNICLFPETIATDPLQPEITFDLLVAAFQHAENQMVPTFTALNAMASFLYRHVSAMIQSMWFNGSAVHLFEVENLARVFKLNVFNMLLKVANDSIARCWSMVNQGKKLAEMDWTNRQRAMFLLGLDEQGSITGMNIVGRDAYALQNMFHQSLLPILQQQCLRFQELRGFRNLMQDPEYTEVILNAMRSLLLLDGTATSACKVHRLDSYPQGTPATQRLQELTGQEQGYVLTGDNMTKMMFALYRIRCGLPVVVFGEAGVGKTALFRFLIETLLGHTFEVFNVNSGTSINQVEESIERATANANMNPNAQVFVFFDEMNTADPPVIAFFKELMLDRHCNGTILPKNLHLMAAANPYRYLQEADKEATVGLAFRFAQTTQNGNGARTRSTGDLVYRVNELPVAFYDHIYDFGHLCNEAEATYIDEICQYGLPISIFHPHRVKWFAEVIRKSHQEARAMSVDPESAVSLRDATRAVCSFRWFYNSPAGKNMSKRDARKAADLSIYLVYAFRFRERKKFLENVFGKDQSASKNMTEVSRIIAKKLYEQAHGASIGSGAIALNDALCENLFALYCCVLNGIFLIIVGRPGSSKSLSVEILKHFLSHGNHMLRHSLGDLPAITEVYFQCSPLSTSSGFKVLFESAQRLGVDPKTMLPMVVLDELGLADMSPEKPIKVLHAELERQSVLTSGEKQQSAFSVVALSNWVVDAAQVNRGILILRTEADKKDLLESAKQLAESLIAKYVNREFQGKCIIRMLTESLKSIVNTYEVLDEKEDIGGGHFFSMRDFFYCVKNFVCSVIESANQMEGNYEMNISQHFLIQSVIRNFGGHEKARNLVRTCMSDNLNINVMTLPVTSPLDLIVSNIQDSSKLQSVHIARHLMILNRSLNGLQLLNRHVKSKLENGMSWNVLFGSCFPGDLQVTAVTRKLRQVEHAIRTGGVLILCHADQLFESLYMVLNQQYWAQGEITMTRIALGPSTRAIALPSGPFRIIALQDTEVALNRETMSPAVLSRFEKHELKPSHLLDDSGQTLLNAIESHSVWLAVPEAIKRQKLIPGYHEESFASLALHLQDRGVPMQVEQDEEENPNSAYTIWMRTLNPMAMIKLERDTINSHPELQDVCRRYRHNFVLESLEDALQNIKSKRMVVMTNTLSHLEIKPISSSRFLIIQLFEVQTEHELVRLLESIEEDYLSDPDYYLIVQYDAVTGPIEQFQLAKYEVEQRFEKSKCRIIFIVHVDPRPAAMHWVFSFGDSWDYCFIDEIVHSGPADQHQTPLKELVQSPADQPLSCFIEKMSVDSFKSLLLELLGPVLQTSLASLRLSLGKFYSGVRTALGLQDNQLLIQLLKECLLAQLMKNEITWNVADAVSDVNFDSSSSLTEGLWGVFKHKISNPLAHLLLVSDVWRISDHPSLKLWCDFVTANYPDRLMSLNPSDSIVQMPIGFRTCTQPFGRLLASFDMHLNRPLQWLLDSVSKNEDGNSQEIKEAYFLDWLKFRIPPHLHHCLKTLPFPKMSYIVDSLFDEPKDFFVKWKKHEADVIVALELVSIASFAKTAINDAGYIWRNAIGRMRNWKFFTETAAHLSLTTLASLETLDSKEKFMQSVASIEVSPALSNLLDRVYDLPQLWLNLRIMKCVLLFDPESKIKFRDLQVSTPKKLFEKLTEIVINSVIRPRVDNCGNRARRLVRQADLYELLKRTSTCDSPQELAKKLKECPITHSIVLLQDNAPNVDIDGRCSSCTLPLKANKADKQIHLVAPSAETIELLFQDNQKFLFFFERVAELFIQQHHNNPHDIRDFLQSLLSSESRLKVSWRFLTVIIRTVLSIRHGIKIIDELLLTIRCNRLTTEMNINEQHFLRALIACADQDVLENVHEEQAEDLIQAAMIGDWNVSRIWKLALIRQQLAVNADKAKMAIIEWSRWRKNQTDRSVTDALLFLILRFTSDEGDQTQLSKILRHPRIAKKLRHHKCVNDYINELSPFSLGFTLRSANFTANPFQERLLSEGPFGVGGYDHFLTLQQLRPDWAPFIARLAYHANDVFVTKNLYFLRVMTSNLVATAEFILPGVDNHLYLPSFQLEPERWYLCSCGTLNCVGNCGRPVAETNCLNCGVALGQNHYVRAGVRLATAQDFLPPHGFHVSRAPPLLATFFVRNCSPVVTRFALLLNALALMNAALNPRTTPQEISQFLLTLPLTERKPVEDRHSFIQLLSNHIEVHLDLLCQLLVTTRHLSKTDKFRIGHMLLHQLLDSTEGSFIINRADYASGSQAREEFENGLARLLLQQTNLGVELDNITGLSSALFCQSLLKNETSYWAYARRVFADRQSVQLELARNGRLRLNFPFLNFLLDDDNGMRKLNALQYLGEALRFVALVRTVLLGEITLEEANRMSIAQGLEKITEIVSQKTIILDRGRPVASRDHVMHLFKGFKQLWNGFSQLENAEKKTFLDYFECQQVNVNVRPKTVLDPTAPLILICAGSELPETTFSCQLLRHAVEAASSIALTNFIRPLCRTVCGTTGSGRVRISCNSAAALADFDESLYAHVSTEKVDRFICDHVIDRFTLQLAESFAMTAVLGSAGSTIAEDLYLEVIPEFVFKDDVDSSKYLVVLERRSIVWQPSAIPPQMQELIIADLEKNRSLGEARSVLISAITYLHSNTEPLVINEVRNHYISDVLEELMRAEILTERHMSNATLSVFNRYLKLEVRHVFYLLKAIIARMKGDDIFGGRIPEGWTAVLSEDLAKLTRQKLRTNAQAGEILDTLLQMVNVITTSQPVPDCLTPESSLLLAIRQTEGTDWDGIPVELKMENLGHVLLIVESLAKK